MGGRRAPGEGAYARLEREQRWVLSGLPGGLGPPRLIADRYLLGTQLRLRSVETDAGIEHKLGQKVRIDESSTSEARVTNLYLSEHEHELLAGLPAAVLGKTRRRLAIEGRTFAVDEHHDHLAGLVLAEVELGSDEPLGEGMPPMTLAEVTSDDCFSGGRLASTSAEGLRLLLAGLTRPR